jgi:Na+-translocating ferredoxin:NAD+ oxidoreductase RNF subunit RnfB
MNTSILILIVLTSVGLIFGFVLAFANKKFAIEVNTIKIKIEVLI